MEVLEIMEEASCKEERERLFREMYKQSFPRVAKFVSQMHGALDDAKDVFQDALILYYNKTMDAGFMINTTPEAYILGIAKHLWIRKFNRDMARVVFDDLERHISIPADFHPTFNEKKLLRLLEHTGRKCMELLKTFYYDRLSMREVMQAMGFASERSATVQKYKCLEKVRDTVKAKAITYEDFFE